MMQTPRTAGRAGAMLAKTTVLTAVAAGALFLAARPDGRAADKDEPAAKAEDSTLDFVPGDAVAFVTVRVGDLFASPGVKAWRAKAGKELSEPLDMRKHLGVSPEEIERITLFSVGGPYLVAVTTLQPYDRKAVLAAAAPEATSGNPDDATGLKLTGRLFFSRNVGAIYFRDDRTFLVGGMGELGEAYVRTPAAWPEKMKPEGPLTPLLRRASEKHLLLAGVDMAAFAKLMGPKDKLPPEVKPFKSLLWAHFATLTVDLDDKLRADLEMNFDIVDSKVGWLALNAGLDLTRTSFAQGLKGLSKTIGDAPKLMALLEDVQAALKTAKAEQNANGVGVVVVMKIDPDAITAALTEGVPKIEEAARRNLISNDFKQLGLAVHAYNDANNGMLPAAIYDKDGKPLLSWRVALLPFLDQEALYKEFHLDEPWDSDHNKKLLEKMPKTFAPPDSQAFKDHETYFQAIVGKDTAFEKPGLSFPASFPDGISNVILFVEAKKAVPWTKPEDVVLDDGKLLPKLGGLSKGGFLAGLCDGSVRFFPLTMKEDALRLWAMRNTNEVKPDPDK